MKNEIIQTVSKVARITAIVYLPTSMIGAAIAGQLRGIEAEWIWVLVTNILGLMSFLVMCSIELMKINKENSSQTLIGVLRSVFLVIIYAFIPLTFFGIFYYAIKIMPLGSEDKDRAFKTILFIWFILCLASCVALYVITRNSRKSIRADQYSIVAQNYEEWVSAFLQRAKDPFGYSIYLEREFSGGLLTICTQYLFLHTLNYMSIVRVRDLSEEMVGLADNIINESLNAYQETSPLINNLNMMTIYCVDRVSSSFYKLVNSDMRQGINKGQLVVGISFGGKQVYIAKQAEEIFPARYKELRKQFMGIAGMES